MSHHQGVAVKPVAEFSLLRIGSFLFRKLIGRMAARLRSSANRLTVREVGNEDSSGGEGGGEGGAKSSLGQKRQGPGGFGEDVQGRVVTFNAAGDG